MTPQCQHCGAHVSERYARVAGDNDGTVHRCLHCDSRMARKQGSTGGVAVALPESDYRRESYGEKARDGLHTGSETTHAAGMPGRGGDGAALPDGGDGA